MEGRGEVTSAQQVANLARAFVDPVGTEPTLREIVAQAVRLVPGRWAAALVADRITTSPSPLVATSEHAVTDDVARIAGRAGTSPGWRAFEEGVTCVVPDLTRETGYGTYPEEMVRHTRIRSVLSVPLVGRDRVVGVLTVYGDRPDAFGTDEVERAQLLAEVAGLALTSASNDDRSANLTRALESNRTIGAAVGIIVERYRLTEELAFDVLRACSQRHNIKLVELAEQLVVTGRLPAEQGSVDDALGARADRSRPA